MFLDFSEDIIYYTICHLLFSKYIFIYNLKNRFHLLLPTELQSTKHSNKCVGLLLVFQHFRWLFNHTKAILSKVFVWWCSSIHLNKSANPRHFLLTWLSNPKRIRRNQCHGERPLQFQAGSDQSLTRSLALSEGRVSEGEGASARGPLEHASPSVTISPGRGRCSVNERERKRGRGAERGEEEEMERDWKKIKRRKF